MKTDKFIINVFDAIGSDAAISVNDGDAIYKKIDTAITNKITVVLDFQNINFIITAFLNACIGQLYSKYSSEDLNKYLKIENVKSEDNHLFNKAIKRAKEYFSNPDDFDKSVNQIMDNEQNS